MRDFLDQVITAVDAELYYLALFGALAIPDLCAAMESPDGRTDGARYAAWFDAHVAPSYSALVTGEDAWGLRCSMLHEGRTQPHRGAYSRVLFVEPAGIVLHNNVFNDALNLNVVLFCRDVVDAATTWLSGAEQTAEYERNYPLFVQRYPNGLAPYIVGMPVIT